MAYNRLRSQQQSSLMVAFARGIIHAYRGVVSPLLMPACRFSPSCSHYALEALRHHGFMRGGWYAIRRLLQCQPWGGQGYDPVPAHNDDKLIKRK